MPQIVHPPAAVSGVSRENVFHVLDEAGMKHGSASVIEYINEALLPDRPLNYHVSISAMDVRAFDMLIGAVLARAIGLTRRQPDLRARVYVPCRPADVDLLRNLQAYGFQNDDAEIHMRRVLAPEDEMPGPPVGCVIASVIVDTQDDCERLLRRVNKYSLISKPMSWLSRLMAEQFFAVYGVWQDDKLLGELILSAYGNEGRIEMLYTRPAYRNRGVASALVAYAGSVLLSAGIRYVNTEVWRRNRNAMALFLGRNFDSLLPIVLYPGIDLKE